MTNTTKQELTMKIISESGLDAYGTPEEFSNAIELAIAYGAQHENGSCKCDECGKLQSDGFALYCVKCIDMINTKEKSKPESLLLGTTNQHEASFTLAIDCEYNTHEFNINSASGIELCVKCGLSKMLYKKSQASAYHENAERKKQDELILEALNAAQDEYSDASKVYLIKTATEILEARTK